MFTAKLKGELPLRSPSHPIVQLALEALQFSRLAQLHQRARSWTSLVQRIQRRFGLQAVRSTYNYLLEVRPDEERAALEQTMSSQILPEVIDYRTIADSYREEGRVEGERAALRTLIEQRFGALPSELAARLDTAGHEQLGRWLGRVLRAESAEALLSRP